MLNSKIKQKNNLKYIYHYNNFIILKYNFKEVL